MIVCQSVVSCLTLLLLMGSAFCMNFCMQNVKKASVTFLSVPSTEYVSCYAVNQLTITMWFLGKSHDQAEFRPLILLHEKLLQFDWLRAVVFQLNLKYLHVKITNLLWLVV